MRILIADGDMARGAKITAGVGDPPARAHDLDTLFTQLASDPSIGIVLIDHDLLRLAARTDRARLDGLRVIAMADDATEATIADVVELGALDLLPRPFSEAQLACRIHLARRVREAQVLRAQKLESIGELAAGIAHEINTPVQYIGDNLRFLDDTSRELLPALRSLADEPAPAARAAMLAALDPSFLEAEMPAAIRQALDGVEHVASIVRAMKRFTHPGEDELSTEDLADAITTTATMTRNQWKYVATLVTEFDPELPRVPCRLGQLNQVLLNLIVNAADAISEARERARAAGNDAPPLGRITIATRRDGDWVEIRVSDTGGGVDPADERRIFEPFFTTKCVGKGTGQGLAISHEIITSTHHGALTVERNADGGATFVIRLPLHAARQVAA